MADDWLTVLSPVGEIANVPLGAGAGMRLAGTLKGKRVAVIDNYFPGMREIADHLEQILKDEFGVSEVNRWQVTAVEPWTEDIIHDIAGHGDVAIIGLGNSAGCSVWQAQFSVNLMPFMPTLNVVTQMFVGVAQSNLRALGYPDSPLFALPTDPIFDPQRDFKRSAREMAAKCQTDLTGGTS